MHVTITVRGALEEDAAMQDIVSILNRKAEESRSVLVEAGEHEPETAETRKGPSPAYIEAGPDLEPPAEPAAPRRRKAAVANPESEAAVADTEAQAAPKPAEAPAVSFENARKAAMEAINAGKRDGVAKLLAKYGDGTLKAVPEGDRPALLAEIEAL